MANKLGVTFANVNRWENGKSTPNNLAQLKLYDICTTYQIPVYDLILERIKEETAGISSSDGRIILYHSSKSGLSGHIAPISRVHCDFGSGFYMGTDPIRPLTLICDFEKAKFYIVSPKIDSVKYQKIDADLEWAIMIAYNREKMESIKGTSFFQKYQAM